MLVFLVGKAKDDITPKWWFGDFCFPLSCREMGNHTQRETPRVKIYNSLPEHVLRVDPIAHSKWVFFGRGDFDRVTHTESWKMFV